MAAVAIPASTYGQGRVVSAAARDSVTAIADSLRAAGLPADPVLAKMAEGELKGADDQRILRAVRSLAHELRAAREALTESASPGTIVAAASAVHVGVRIDDVRALARRHLVRDADLAGALITLADLVANGVPAADAVQAIGSLVAQGVSERDLDGLRAGVAQDVRGGQPPGLALRTRARALSPRAVAPLDDR
ncbi:MAG TPA: hypothetical protein VJ867_17720 [Gemmatimonadaceae bacterium]|nr:hypothetical protein [Gemmatimonadaceae bacterium]